MQQVSQLPGINQAADYEETACGSLLSFKGNLFDETFVIDPSNAEATFILRARLVDYLFPMSRPTLFLGPALKKKKEFFFFYFPTDPVQRSFFFF